jgi:hypothetical protein
VGESIWLVAGEVVNFYGFPYSTRCIVVRLRSGDLWIWSPVKLSDGLCAAVDGLGSVAHLVSPNKLHHLYLSEWQSVYPDARLWGPASTIRKRPDLRFAGTLTEEAPSQWGEEITQFWFRGSFAMDEIVFFHRPSSTAILADLSENFSPEFLSAHWSAWQRVLARLWRITVGYGYAPLELRLSWFNRRFAREALAALLDSNPRRVVMAHGEWQQENGRAYLQRAFAWLGA